jgi:alkanesulfonate monooxygenase
VLTEPEVTFEGKYVKVIEASCPYSCVQRPHPPLYLGVSSPAGLQLAARRADVRLSWGELPEQLADRSPRIAGSPPTRAAACGSVCVPTSSSRQRRRCLA